MEIITITDSNVGNRLDQFITKEINNPTITRSFISNNIDKIVKVNGKREKKSYSLRLGDLVEIDQGVISTLIDSTIDTGIVAQQGDLNILFENDDYLIIDKPSGLVMHPGDGNRDNTLANYIVNYMMNKGMRDNTLERAGLVHRLDKGVSGLVVVAKTREMQLILKKQFEEHSVIKIYLAQLEQENDSIVDSFEANEIISELLESKYSSLDKWERVEGYISRDSTNRKRMRFSTNSQGKYARSYIYWLNKNSVLIKIETGRMHQIRATLKYLGYSIKGDTLYNKKSGNNPESISLRSILLGFKNREGLTVIYKAY